MSDEKPRLIRAQGHCVCGHANPTFEASGMIESVLVANCCGALYLDRGPVVSLLKDWRRPPHDAEEALKSARDGITWHEVPSAAIEAREGGAVEQ